MRDPLDVYVTFDVEVWCNGWRNLDFEFPSAFQRYVYGSSSKGEFALPKTLEILNRNRLKGVFFVEPLFAARFGLEYLRTIVDLIRGAGQEVQLHLHTEWVDEIQPKLIDDVSRKRQHMSAYLLDEQIALLCHGMRLLDEAGAPAISAFRAGSFAVNAETYVALSRIGIKHDSSIDLTFSESARDIREAGETFPFTTRNGVFVHPLTVVRDGLGRLRHAQVGACSFEELRDGMESAYAQSDRREYVILSHNFEMLRPGTNVPDDIVVRRFERLCAWLNSERTRFRTSNFKDCDEGVRGAAELSLPEVGLFSTGRRYVEQILRRL